MAARKRRTKETFQEYRKNLRAEEKLFRRSKHGVYIWINKTFRWDNLMQMFLPAWAKGDNVNWTARKNPVTGGKHYITEAEFNALPESVKH